MKPWIIKGLVILACIGAFFALRRPLMAVAQRFFLPVVARFSTWADRIDHAGRSIALPNEGEIERCEERLQTRIVDAARLSALEQENRLLRAQASFLTESGYDHVGARVIGRRIDHIHAQLLIDRGTNDAIEEGQAVIAENGLLVGRIVEANSRVSTVELLTDVDSRIAVASAKDGQLIGVLEGRGNGAALLTYIPSSVDVVADDLLLTAGTEEKIPPRLPIGMANAITRTSKDPFYQASVDPAIRIERLSFLSVLRPTALTR